MVLSLRDYQVTFTCEETIAEIALEWRKAAGKENSAEFNIVDFVENVLAKRLRKKGPLHFDFYEKGDNDEFAFVTFAPQLTLHVDREIWKLAKQGEPYAKFIVAHEAGHIILHNNHAKSFSNDPQAQIRFAQNEYSAEWQANIFAAHFLLPDHIVRSFNDADELIKSCSVIKQLAEDRLDAMRLATKRRTKIENDICLECGNFTLVRNGTCMKCDTCGSTTGCS